MHRLVPALLTLSFVACAVQKSAEPVMAPEPPPSTPAAPAGPQQQGYPPGQAPPQNVLRGESSEIGYASVEDAERDLERARRELVGVTEKNRRETKKSEEPAPMGGAESECGNACKAFASLRRAANAVCRLTNETDARCVRARSVV